MSVRVDLTGRRYGSLIVMELAADIPGKKKKWLCKCDCGKKIVVAGSNLQSGHTGHCKECGLRLSNASKIKHGKTRTKIYYVWRGILDRCENINNVSYSDYGARGISVCEEWHDPIKFFAWAEGNGYKEGLEIDRIDTNGNYCPENCRWVTRLENANNKANNKIILHLGVEKTLAEWARFYGVNYKNLSRNLNKGYSLEEAVERGKSSS